MTDDDHTDERDKRRFGRSPVTLVVEYEDAEEFVGDYTENLSSGGIFVTTQRDFRIDDTVQLVLSFPALLRPIRVSGTVRWIRVDDGETGVGIEFTTFDSDARARFGALVSSIQERDPTVVSRLLKILVVEDNPHVAKLISEGLRGAGRRAFGDRVAFNFRMASNGREALQLLSNEVFDALIIDIYLPILDGSTVIRNVRASDRLRNIPVIAVSAGGEAARESAITSGADFFLDKPMRLRQVIETMKRLINLEL